MTNKVDERLLLLHNTIDKGLTVYNLLHSTPDPSLLSISKQTKAGVYSESGLCYCNNNIPRRHHGSGQTYYGEKRKIGGSLECGNRWTHRHALDCIARIISACKATTP